MGTALGNSSADGSTAPGGTPFFVSAADSVFSNNNTGIQTFAVGPGQGLAKVSILNGSITGNSGNGLEADYGAISVGRSLIANNNIGANITTGSLFTQGDNTFRDNISLDIHGVPTSYATK